MSNTTQIARPRTVSARPSEIAIGDRVLHYGVLFEITDKSWSCHHGLRHNEHGPDRPCYYLTTKLIEYPAEGSTMPRQWAETWHFQGNDFASFAKVVEA